VLFYHGTLTIEPQTQYSNGFLSNDTISTYRFADRTSTQAFENTSTNVAASQMRNALNKLADTVTDPAEKKVSRNSLRPSSIPRHPLQASRYNRSGLRFAATSFQMPSGGERGEALRHMSVC
jgi:hypothetical protein